ncbi:MAG: deoxyribose-phosphate aldolase [Treponema sp.]|nr:deoxyribose-phosphate aldolase [Treponema sp.]
MDHTVLKPETVKATLKKFCDEAKQYHFASVCVNPANVPYVASQLKGSGVKTCSVIGFPLGASTPFIKAAEATEAVKNGAEEVDMVINVGALKDKEYDVVYNDILAVVNAAHPHAIVKVIIETCLLSDEEKVAACTLAKKAGADFVKTSTGFGTGGATVEDVKLMKQTVGDGVKVKASTGINDRRVCDEMLKAGAVRMGTSKGIKIIKGEVDPLPEDCEKCGKCSAKCPTGLVTITKQSY